MRVSASFTVFLGVFAMCTSVTISNGNNAILSKPQDHYIPACVSSCNEGNDLPYNIMCVHSCTLDAIRPDGLDAWLTYFIRALLFSALYSYAISESLLALIPPSVQQPARNRHRGSTSARNTRTVMIGFGALALVILLMGGISVQKKLLASVFPATWTARPYDIYTTVGMGMASGHAVLLLYIRWLLWTVFEPVEPCDSDINAYIDGVIVLILWSTLWWEFHYISQCFIGFVVAVLLINLVRKVSDRCSSYIPPSKCAVERSDKYLRQHALQPERRSLRLALARRLALAAGLKG